MSRAIAQEGRAARCVTNVAYIPSIKLFLFYFIYRFNQEEAKSEGDAYFAGIVSRVEVASPRSSSAYNSKSLMVDEEKAPGCRAVGNTKLEEDARDWDGARRHKNQGNGQRNRSN
eukprot:CAMPEP_0171536534 /NCGR_PEP_ID=MMETSP0959-20130129/17869_1 /TAXON_ID=87120 /ORGANISM="Aurantiochytrium limacinum, Strain ATCCMYA-1381" /LENGTH=114 /DNA_ID=CAMNT_0012082813 /DNA_START=853 /DNA_END=1195 /DNA_ORIENTATION=-